MYLIYIYLLVFVNLVPSYMQTPVSVVHYHNTRYAARGDVYVSSANPKYYTIIFSI